MYLISFPIGAIDVPQAKLAEVFDAAYAVVQGVFAFAGGLGEEVVPVVVRPGVCQLSG